MARSPASPSSTTDLRNRVERLQRQASEKREAAAAAQRAAEDMKRAADVTGALRRDAA